MKKHQCGEVATLLVVVIAAGAFIFGALAPRLSPITGLFHRGTAAKEKASFVVQQKTVTPVMLESSNGKHTKVGKKIEFFYSTSAQEKVPKKTLGEKIGDFFAHLTIWGLVFVFVSLAAFGGAPLLFLYRRYRVILQALKNTVKGIRELDPPTYNALTEKLSETHTVSDRKVVDDIKKGLH